MARKIAKPYKNSRSELVKAANAPDLSATTPPEVMGIEVLDNIGKQAYADLWRGNAAKWTSADLLLLIEAAFLVQRAAKLRPEVLDAPATVTHSTGIIGINPTVKAYDDLSLKLRNICRDLGIRSKDGAPPAVKSTPVNAVDNVSWLDQMAGKK